MSMARKVALGLAGLAGCVAVLAPGEASAVDPIGVRPVGPAPAVKPPPPPPQVRISAAAVRAAMDRATGAAKSECNGALVAAQAYAACKEKCAQKAETSPITPAELAKCGSQSAEDCAAQLIASRAKDCIASPAPDGCKDDFAKLQGENAECKSCKDLTAASAIGTAAVQKQTGAVAKAEKAVAQAQEALANERATLAAYEGMASALATKTAKICAAAQK